MNTPNGTGGEPRHRELPGDAGGGSIRWCLECLAGGVTAAFVLLLAFPALLDLIHPFGLLSTTWLMFLFVVTWLFAWAVLAATRAHLSVE